MLKARVPLLSVLLVCLWLGGAALAARNSSGTYSLPAGNPVVTGTTITSTWANNTLNDIKTEITNSLDRQGRGAMLAPLQIVSGTAAAPGLTGSAEPSSGLYRAAAGDWRFSVLTVPVMKWTTSLVSSLVPLTVTGRTTTTDLTVTGTSAALAVVSGTPNVRGLSATGNGNAAGVNAFGGTTSGAGISAAGGAPNGLGLQAEGAGTGIGVVAIGGSFAAAGVHATGGASGVGGNGVVAVGQAQASGVDATGGATNGTGVVGRAGGGTGIGVAGRGSGSGAGVFGWGGATGVGVLAQAGTDATGPTRSVAVQLTNGDIDLDSVVDPDSNTALTNRITPKNVLKAWGTIGISAATVTVDDGVNITGGAVSTNLGGAAHGGDTIDITFASAFANSNYAVVFGDVLNTSTVPCHPFVYAKSPTVLSIQMWRMRVTGAGFAATDIFEALCVQSVNSPPYAYTWTNQKLSFAVYGAQ